MFRTFLDLFKEKGAAEKRTLMRRRGGGGGGKEGTHMETQPRLLTVGSEGCVYFVSREKLKYCPQKKYE